MKPETLEFLACPGCRGGLQFLGHASGSIESGSLRCITCTREFPIEEGIPRFIRYEELTGLNRRFARLYDWFSHVYVPISKIAYGFIGGEERNRREVLDRLDPNEGRVLEVSIGPGVNPGFKCIFKGEREAVSAPVEFVPPAMADVRVTDVWRGWGYCLEFCKP